MFDYVIGSLASKNFPYCTVECNNVGWLFLVNFRTISKLPELNSKVKIYSKLIHKEDTMFHCGFLTKQDRTIFEILIGVNGIGTKAALALLDEFETADLISAVINEDHKQISKTKGIGPKTAQKIVLELKDKLTKLDIVDSEAILSNNNLKTKVTNETIAQTQTILQSLGYTNNEYKKAIEEAILTIETDDPEELLKETLKILSVF